MLMLKTLLSPLYRAAARAYSVPRLAGTLALMLSLPGLLMSQKFEDYYREAAQNNAGLRAQYHRYEAAVERVSQEKGWPDPKLSLGYFINPVETRVGPQLMRFSLKQSFPWWGSTKLRGETAQKKAEAEFQKFLEQRNLLYRDLSKAYYDLYEWKRKQAILQEQIEVLKSFKEMASARYRNGEKGLSDVIRTDIKLQETQTELKILKEEKGTLLQRFNQLRQAPLRQEVSIADSLAYPLRAEALQSSDSLNSQHPQVQLIEAQQQAWQRKEKLARKDGMPQFGAGLDYLWVGPRPEVGSLSGQDVLMPSIQVQIPIFRKKYRAAVQAAQLQQDALREERKEKASSLKEQIHRASFQLDRQMRLLELYSEQISRSQRSLRLLRSSYASAGEDFEEVLRMRQQVLHYQLERLKAQVKVLVTQAQIEYLTAKVPSHATSP